MLVIAMDKNDLRSLRETKLEDNHYFPDFPIYSAHHKCDVTSDLAQLSEDEAIEKYRRIFLADHIHQVNLETPEEALIPALDFKVTLHSGELLRVILRIDGKACILERHEQMLHYVDPRKPRTIAAYCPASCVPHTINSTRILRDIQDADRQFEGDPPDRSEYEELFWAVINPTLPYPYIRRAVEIQDTGVSFERGTRDQLEALMADAGDIADSVWSGGASELMLYVSSACEGNCANADPRANHRLPSEIVALLDILAKWANPTGHIVKNNGAGTRSWEHYFKAPYPICAKIQAPSCTERIEALERIIAWADTAGIDIDHLLPR